MTPLIDEARPEIGTQPLTAPRTISATPKRSRSLLAQVRDWHSWIGLGASLVIVLVAGTGIYLEWEDLFGGSRGMPEGPSGLLTLSTDFGSLPIGPRDAMEAARPHLAGAVVENIQLKDEHGVLVWKVKGVAHGEGRRHKTEVVITATTGAVLVKHPDSYSMEYRDGHGTVVHRGTDWNKVLLDLHTGKILGTMGHWIAAVAALVLVALTATGAYVWGKAALVRYRARRARAAA